MSDVVRILLNDYENANHFLKQERHRGRIRGIVYTALDHADDPSFSTDG